MILSTNFQSLAFDMIFETSVAYRIVFASVGAASSPRKVIELGCFIAILWFELRFSEGTTEELQFHRLGVF